MTSFLREHDLPGAALAVAKEGRIVYARGFGCADRAARTPVEPDSLFRIASVSKPITSAAVLLLVERGRLALDLRVFPWLGIVPFVPAGGAVDPRLERITIRDLLRHAGGFDRDKSGDPMFMARRIAADLGVACPPAPAEVIRWMEGRPLDFDPGTRYAYSNFGYCVLGRAIEKASGLPYERFVREQLLAPLGITSMRLGRTLAAGRAAGEVTYDGASESPDASVFDRDGAPVPSPYGAWCLETMDAHGGWIASAPDLVRFACALGEPGRVLNAESLAELWARPEFVPKGADGWYGLGWFVRPAGGGINAWHTGSLPGTSTLLVRRHDGFTWAVLFNSRAGNPANAIDPLIHRAVDAVKEWP
jgi:N-acyl-D-amino-acid deacylase